MTALRDDLLNQIAEDCKALALPRLRNNITISAFPFDVINDEDLRAGGYVTSEKRKRGSKMKNTNERNAYGYPFLVSFFTGTSNARSESTREWSSWLENIMRRYDRRRFSMANCPKGVAVICCTAEEVDIDSETARRRHLYGQHVEVTVWVLEPRTNR